MVIPGEAPSSGLRRTGVLATGAPRRVAARGACDALRRTPVEVFFVRRVMAVVLFERWGVFFAPGFFCGFLVPCWGFLGGDPKKKAPPGGGAGGGGFFLFFCLLTVFF